MGGWRARAHGLGANAARAYLRRGMLAYFCMLVLPLIPLLWILFQKLFDEALLRERLAAEQFAGSISRKLSAVIDEEEARPFDHYSFYTLANLEFNEQKALQRSPLSSIDPAPRLGGLLGYFQIAPDGSIS